MNHLIQRNKRGDLAPCGGRDKGFLIDGRRVGGLYRYMRKQLSLSGAKFRKNGARNRVFTMKIPPGYRVAVTNMARGRMVHRRVQHALFCKTGALVTPCHCRFAKRETLLEQQYVEAARQFTQQYSLTPLAAELVVPAVNMATQVDALFRDRNQDVVLVSWKTGTPPNESSEQLNAHKMQLSAEWALLEQHNHVSLAAAYVVYLTALYNKQNKAQCTRAFSVLSMERADAIQRWNDATIAATQ